MEQSVAEVLEMGQAINAVYALFGLLLGTLLGHWIERTLYRPKVIIEFGEESRYIRKEGKYVSIVITNKGRTAAINTVGTITLEDIRPEDIIDPKNIVKEENLPIDNYVFNLNDQLLTPENLREIEREQLCWASIGNDARLTINPGIKTLLDVFKAIKNEETGEWYIVIPTEAGWKKQRVRLKDRNYRGCLMVSPENSSPTRRFFRINPSNTSDQTAGPWIELLEQNKIGLPAL